MISSAHIAARKRKRIIQTFRAAGAVEASKACSPENLGLSQDLMLDILNRRKILMEVRPGYFYLDETNEKNARRMRIVFLCILAAAAILILIVKH